MDLENQAINSEAKNISVAMQMVNLSVINDSKENVKSFIKSLSQKAYGTPYEGIVRKYIESLDYKFD